jgi:hypothetical protein
MIAEVASRVWAVTVVACLLGAGPAFAQPQAGQTVDPAVLRAEAEDHFQAGVALMQTEDWDAARTEFQRSLEIFPTRSALFNLGMCFKALHRYVESLETLRRWQAEHGAAAGPEERRSAEAAIAELEALVGQLSIGVNLPGATVTLDGESVGASPVTGTRPIEVGDHVLEATLDGYEPARQQFTVASREIVRIELYLAPLGTTAATTSTSTSTSTSTTTTVPAATGIGATWFWVTGGTAVALGIGAAVTGALVIRKDGEFDDAVTRCNAGDDAACAEGHSIADDETALGYATTTLIIAAAAAAAAAATLAFFTDWGGDEEEAPAAAVGLAPVVGDGGGLAGLALGAVLRY